jgi:hypothetical protein
VAIGARRGTAAHGRVEGRGLASREPALLDLAAEALSRRRVAVETPDYEEQSAFRHEAQKAGSSLASLEAALAPGRLDIC